ncbi:hypothetical protein [Streptomyces sp. NPDC049585]|uniref:hypothetical protein n=1 Tax=Streptomyces sp. NPDC049585 TaxID=3155154 RepID=UPI0034443739
MARQKKGYERARDEQEPGAHSGKESRARERSVPGTASAREGYQTKGGTARGEALEGVQDTAKDTAQDTAAPRPTGRKRRSHQEE